MPTANLLYVAMQCADIFFLKADICHLGMDQRNVNMLARVYAAKSKVYVIRPPVVISHHMLMGLQKNQAKMSKSHPDSAIFMEDSPDDERLKINDEFCTQQQNDDNPIMDYTN
eukprot:53148_1